MVDLVREALQLQTFLQAHKWRFCFIGGLAVQVWGEPRLTRDIDLSLMTGYGSEESFIDTILAEYPARLKEARAFALLHRTLLVQTISGVPLDISLAALPFEDSMISRAVDYAFVPGQTLRVCSAEDLVVMKVFAGRPIDLGDVESIVTRQKFLNWSHIESTLEALDEIRGTSGLVEHARNIRQKRKG